MVHFGLLGASSASGPPVSGDAAVSGHFFRGQSSGHGSVSERADQSGDAGNGSRPADASESRPRPAAVSRERRSLALQSVGERHFRQFADAGPTGTGSSGCAEDPACVQSAARIRHPHLRLRSVAVLPAAGHADVIRISQLLPAGWIRAFYSQ